MSRDTQLLATIQREMRGGFTLLADSIAQTNAGLQRLENKTEQVEGRLNSIEGRLDRVENKLDRTITEFRDFRIEVNIKLNGISSLLIASERNIASLEKRVVRLEDRVDRLEDKPGQAS